VRRDELILLRRAKDLIDREYARPLDVPALARAAARRPVGDDVCMEVGCTSPGSFSTRFTELVGESPSAYRARDHAAGQAIPACYSKVNGRPSRIGEASPAPRP